MNRLTGRDSNARVLDYAALCFVGAGGGPDVALMAFTSASWVSGGVVAARGAWLQAAMARATAAVPHSRARDFMGLFLSGNLVCESKLGRVMTAHIIHSAIRRTE